MANITATTLAACKRTNFYAINRLGVPIRLPYQVVTIDSDFAAYEPIPSNRISPTGLRADGEVDGVVYVASVGPVPPPPPGQTGVFGVFLYNGI